MLSSFTQLTIREVTIGIISAATLAAVTFLATKFRAKISTRVHNFFIRRRKSEFSYRMLAEGVSNFYVGRDDWSKYRIPAGLGDYIGQAKKSVQIACYWMAQGTIEGIPRICAELAERGIYVEIVMIDPNGSIPDVLQYDLETRPDTIRQHVRAGLETLQRLRSTLSAVGQEQFVIKVSPTLPQAAVILLDRGTATSKIQLEFRPYKESRSNSFSIEVSAAEEGRLYTRLEKSWSAYFKDANNITATRARPASRDRKQ